MAEFGRVHIRSFAVGRFRLRQFVRLRVSISEQVQQHRRGRMLGNPFQQLHGFFRLAFIHQKLRQLLDGLLVFGIGLQDAAQNLFALVVLVLKPVKPCEPEGGFGISGIEPIDFAELFNGFVGRFGLAGPGVHVAQAAQIDSSQQAARLNIVGISLEKVFCFGFGFLGTLRFPVDFREPLANNG